MFRTHVGIRPSVSGQKLEFLSGVYVRTSRAPSDGRRFRREKQNTQRPRSSANFCNIPPPFEASRNINRYIALRLYEPWSVLLKCAAFPESSAIGLGSGMKPLARTLRNGGPRTMLTLCAHLELNLFVRIRLNHQHVAAKVVQREVSQSRSRIRKNIIHIPISS